MRLFDEIARDYQGPARYTEPEFCYLNRSARIRVARIRQVLETWFSSYPTAHQKALCQDFRSADDSQHRSAFFELFLHQLLLRLGCYLTIHPSPAETTKYPDFLIEPPGGACFYLEAVLATGESRKECAARARMNAVYDTLDQLESPDFFIGMELKGAPRTPPRGTEIRSFIACKLASLDPDQIIRQYESSGLVALPRWRFEHDGWRIDFFPIPKKPDARGRVGVRPLAWWSPEGWRANTVDVIRDAISRKASRYGRLDLPYVIAVNVLSITVDELDVIEALDGAWTSRADPDHTRVSAVLVANNLLPWNIPRAGIRLYP